MKICKLPTASVSFDKTSYLYILPFFHGQAGPLTSFRGPAQNLGALGYWAPVSLFPCSMINKLLNEHHLECLSLKGGCTGLSESTHVKMPHCWKSHVTAHLSLAL